MTFLRYSMPSNKFWALSDLLRMLKSPSNVRLSLWICDVLHFSIALHLSKSPYVAHQGIRVIWSGLAVGLQAIEMDRSTTNLWVSFGLIANNYRSCYFKVQYEFVAAVAGLSSNGLTITFIPLKISNPITQPSLEFSFSMNWTNTNNTGHTLEAR